MSEIILWEDEAYIENFQQLAGMFRLKQEADFKRKREFNANETHIQRLVRKGEIDSEEADVRRDAFSDKNPSNAAQIMAKIGNCAGVMAYRLYELYDENPDFETVDENLKIDILFGEVPEETLFRNRDILLAARGKYVEGTNVVYIFQDEGFSIYPDIESVRKRIKETKISKVSGIKADDIRHFAENCISNSEPEVQAQSFALSLYGPEILRQRCIASRKGQPGSQE